LREQQRLMAVVVGVTEHLLLGRSFGRPHGLHSCAGFVEQPGLGDRAADELVEGAFLQFAARKFAHARGSYVTRYLF
jgi:hypothetical protein